MLLFNRFMAILMTIVMLAPMAPLEAKTRKGDRFLAEGRAHEDKKEWDAALENYEKALSEDPSELTYQMAAQKARFEASGVHLSNGVKVRTSGQLGEALLEFQKAYALNPSSSAAEQEILRTQEMIQRERLRVEQTGREAAPEVRGLTPSEMAKKETEDRINRLLPIPELKALDGKRMDFHVNNQTPKVLFDTLAAAANLNVIYDPEYVTNGPKEKQTVNFTNQTVQEALDDLALYTHSYWKPFNANTIFVTMDTANKRRDYEEEVTRIFYLTNTTTNADLTAIVTAIRTVADVQRLFPFESQSAIVAKATADRIALAEKIIHDLDKPKSEVVVDIFVMEASSVYMRSLAAGPFSTGVSLSANYTPRSSLQVQSSTTATTTTSTTTASTATTTGAATSSTTGEAIPFSHIGQTNAGDWSTTLPSAVFTATLSDTRTKVLQSPQLRAVDGQKATMKIGEKEPTASGSFQPGLGGVAGAGISPLVNTQFTYLDVGVNVEVTPHVHENGEISLILDLDISSVTGQVNLGGINEPIIGQRKIHEDLRLREGEVSLLGGLLNTQDNTTKTGVPGLANVPLIGKLFSGNSVDRERDEIMVALIPHVVRRPDITPENVRGVASGPINQLSVRRSALAPPPNLQVPPGGDIPPAMADASATPSAPVADAGAAKPPAPSGPTLPAAGATVPGAPQLTAPMAAPLAPAPTPPPADPGGLMPPATAPPEKPAAAPATVPAKPTGPVKISFDQSQITKNAGDSFTVTLQVENARDVVSAPVLLQYDPKILALSDVSAGKFWSGDGQEPQPATKNVQNEAGMATVGISRKSGSPSISGTGALLTLTFNAVGKGTATISASNVTLNNSQNQMVGSGSPKMTVEVK